MVAPGGLGDRTPTAAPQSGGVLSRLTLGEMSSRPGDQPCPRVSMSCVLNRQGSPTFAGPSRKETASMSVADRTIRQ